MTLAERLERHSIPEPNTGCWLWLGAVAKTGYGSIQVAHKTRLVHRVAYELLVGPIPAGLQLDHLCRVRSCLNPAHLEPVTARVNVQRGERATKTHCVRGHAFDEQNTHRNHKGYRICRACMRFLQNRWAAANPEKIRQRNKAQWLKQKESR